MSNLYASIKGERGEATRCGRRTLRAHIRGWDSGIAVVANHADLDSDEFEVYATEGSNGYGRRLIGTLHRGRFYLSSANEIEVRVGAEHD